MTGILNTGSDSTTVYSKPYYLVDNFKRYIKPDPTLFPTFKYQVLWYNCNSNTIATACAQNVEDVLHKANVPLAPYYMYLFRGGEYIYSGFFNTTNQPRKENYT